MGIVTGVRQYTGRKSWSRCRDSSTFLTPLEAVARVEARLSRNGFIPMATMCRRRFAITQRRWRAKARHEHGRAYDPMEMP